MNSFYTLTNVLTHMYTRGDFIELCIDGKRFWAIIDDQQWDCSIGAYSLSAYASIDFGYTEPIVECHSLLCTTASSAYSTIRTHRHLLSIEFDNNTIHRLTARPLDAEEAAMFYDLLASRCNKFFDPYMNVLHDIDALSEVMTLTSDVLDCYYERQRQTTLMY